MVDHMSQWTDNNEDQWMGETDIDTQWIPWDTIKGKISFITKSITKWFVTKDRED